MRDSLPFFFLTNDTKLIITTISLFRLTLFPPLPMSQQRYVQFLFPFSFAALTKVTSFFFPNRPLTVWSCPSNMPRPSTLFPLISPSISFLFTVIAENLFFLFWKKRCHYAGSLSFFPPSPPPSALTPFSE